MQYGDVAKVSEKWQERFESGCFGTLNRADVILNFNHNRAVPLCRTGGGGLTLIDNPDQLRVEAILPETQAGNDALELVRNRVVRGFSVEFEPQEIVEERGEKRNTSIIRKATLRNIGLVDRPAYPKSKVNPRSEDAMNEEQLAELIDTKLKEFAENLQPEFDIDDYNRSVKDMVVKAVKEFSETAVRAQVDAALQERDEAKAKAEQAEKEKETAESEAEGERDKIVADAEERAELMITMKPLLPEDFEFKGKTKRELLVEAIGDEVDNIENRSEDYLLAKAEGILERRSQASQSVPAADPERVRNFGGVNINRIISNQRNEQMKHLSGLN